MRRKTVDPELLQIWCWMTLAWSLWRFADDGFSLLLTAWWMSGVNQTATELVVETKELAAADFTASIGWVWLISFLLAILGRGMQFVIAVLISRAPTMRLVWWFLAVTAVTNVVSVVSGEEFWRMIGDGFVCGTMLWIVRPLLPRPKFRTEAVPSKSAAPAPRSKTPRSRSR